MSKTYSSSVFKPFNGDISGWPAFKRSCIVAANGLQLQGLFPSAPADASKLTTLQQAALSDLYLAMYSALTDEALIHVDEAALSGDPLVMYKALCSVYEDRSTEVCKALRDRFERCSQRGRSIALFLGELATIQASLQANGQPYSEDDLLARMSAGIDSAFQLQANILALTPGMTFAVARMKMVKYGMATDRPQVGSVDSLPLGHLALHSARHDAAASPPTLPRESSRSHRFKKCVNCGELGHFAETCQRRECSACGGTHLYRDCFARLGLTTAAQRQQHIAKARALSAPKSGNVVASAPAIISYPTDLADDYATDDDTPIMAFTVQRVCAPSTPCLSLPRYMDDVSEEADLPLSAFLAPRALSLLRSVDLFVTPPSDSSDDDIVCSRVSSAPSQQFTGHDITWGSFSPSHFVEISESHVSCAVVSSPTSLRRHSSAIVDSGATDHFTAREDLLRDAVPLDRMTEVFMANSAPLTLTASGTLSALPGSCYLAPDISNSLISVPRLDEAGLVTIIKSGTLVSGTLSRDMHPQIESIMRALWSPRHCAVFASLYKGLYRADLDNLTGLPPGSHPQCNIALYPRFHCSTLRDLVRSCHEAWGHMSQADMLTVVRTSAMPGLPPLLTVSAIRRNWHICKACVEGTFAATPLPHHSSASAALSTVGELVCIDGYGKISPSSYGGYQYWVISVCAYSHYVYCHLVKSRSEYPDAVSAIIIHYQRQGHCISTIQTDVEFLSTRIQSICAQHNIVLRSSAPHEHAQNGIAERHNRTLAEKVTVALRNFSNTPKEAWALATYDCAFKLNLRPILSDHRTPYELFHGKPLDLTTIMLLPFGLPVAAHVPSQLRNGPFDARTFDGIVVGVAPQYKLAVQVLNLQTLRINIRRSLVPTTSPTLDAPTSRPDADSQAYISPPLSPVTTITSSAYSSPSPPAAVHPFCSSPNPYAVLSDDIVDIDSSHTLACSDTEDTLCTPPDTSESDHACPAIDNSLPDIDTTVVPPCTSPPSSSPTIASSSSPISASNDGIPAEQSPIASPAPTSRSGRLLKRPTRFANILATPSTSDLVDPVSLIQARQRPDSAMWLTALEDEMSSLHSRGTFISIASLPSNTRSLATKFVFKRVINPDGSVKKYKVRLVVRGDLQSADTFGSTSAGTVQRKSVFLLLALATQFDCEIYTMDVKSAFLYADLAEDIYITLPKAYTDPGPRQHAKLVKSLYGLKQAAFEFSKLLCSVLTSYGCTRLVSDPQVFMKHDGNSYLVLCTHVDDILIVTNDSSYMKQFTDYLATHFDTTANAIGSSYIGMSIVRDRSHRSMFLSQRGYIQQILSKYCTHPHYVSTPADYTQHMELSEVFLDGAARLDFMRVVGALNYLAHCTRPDILYAVHYLSTKFTSPTETDRRRAQRVLNYLYSTPDLGVSFTASSSLGIYGHADASFANGPSRRSEYGLCYSLSPHCNFFHAVSKVQTIISLSSTEAEYIAASECAKELRWLQHFFSELPVFRICTTPAVLFQDNKSTIQLASEVKYYERSKHIDLRYHFLRHHVIQGNLHVTYRDTDHMTADILTKPLLPHRYVSLRNMLLGPQPVPSYADDNQATSIV